MSDHDGTKRIAQQGTDAGAAASEIYLPAMPERPATILAFLVARFPHVGAEFWRERMEAGKVLNGAGEPIAWDTPYTAGTTVRYFRETPDEASIPFEEAIIHQDDHLIVADKPHFLPVVPSGPYVAECLLARLRARTGIETLVPVHRLDRETAGLVLFSVDTATRPLYHRMFAEGAIEKEYLAIGHGAGDPGTEMLVENRIVQGEPWFRMRVAPGTSNAATHIRLLDRLGERALFRLRPRTGKKHQLRLHLLSIGFPILNDRLYPHVLPHAPYDFTAPLQLLAQRLAFTDPVSGLPMELTSRRQLECAWTER